MPSIIAHDKPSAKSKELNRQARVGTLDSIRIDSSAPFANVIYKSDNTGEIGTIYVWKGMAEEDVLKQYAERFPRDCALHLKHVQALNSALDDPAGMSKERIMAAVASFPKVLQICLEYIDPNYFHSDDPAKYKKKLYAFVRKFPKFMVGDHRAAKDKYVPRIQHPGSDAYTVTDKRGSDVRSERQETIVSPGDDRQGRDGDAAPTVPDAIA